MGKWKNHTWLIHDISTEDFRISNVAGLYPEIVVWRCYLKNGVLENFTKFTAKHLCQSLFFNQVADVKPSVLLKKWLWRRCFSVNFMTLLRTLFFIEHLRWLLLFLTILMKHELDSIMSNAVEKWVLARILVNWLRKSYFLENCERQIVIQLVLTTTLFNKFPLKNILNCIYTLN